MKLFYRLGVPVFITAAVWACGGGGGGTSQNPTLTVEKVSGDSQVADAGTALAAALVVIVKDDKGNPVSGQTVTWTAASGGGSVTPGGATGADGKASATRTLGPNAGIQTTSAKLGSSTFVFTNISHIQGATQISLNGGGGGADTVLSAVAPYSVLVRDETNTPVANVTVNWTVTAGGGLLSGSTSQTNASGIAQITHTLSALAGAQRVQAEVTGLAGSPITFTTTATAGNPTVMLLSSGNNQVGPVSTALTNPHVVLVKDGHGNPVSGVTVNWVVGLGGGSISSSAPLTQANGTASISRTLGAAAGVNSDTASVTGLTGSPVAFTDTAGAVSNIQVKDDFFTPDTIAVTAGTFIKYTWAGAISHNVTWNTGDPSVPAGSATQSSGTYTVRLTATGAYGYHCTIHGTAGPRPGCAMCGVVTVN